MFEPKKKTFLLLSFSVIFFMPTLYAQTYLIEDILDAKLIKELKEKGEVKHTLEKDEKQLALTPDTPIAKKAAVFHGNEKDEDPSFISESLYLVKKSDLIVKSKKPDPEVSIDEVSRIVRSISKMKGMMYFSNSRQEWDVLYSESYMIEGPDSDTPIPDMLEGSADGLKLYCFQNEHAFGGSKYSLTYNQSESEVSVTFQNLDPLKYTFIRAVKKGNMNINVVVTDCGESFLVYMVIQARILRWSVLEKRMNKSLNARLDAIYKWFTEQF